MTLPLVISPGDPGHIADHEEIHGLLTSGVALLDEPNTFAWVNTFEEDTFFASGKPWADPTADTFGALANGVANDTDAIIDATGQAGVDGIVYFPTGTYMVNPFIEGTVDGLQPMQGQKWVFAPGAVLKARVQGALPHAAQIIDIRDVAGVTVEGATVHGNDSGGAWAAGVVLGISVRSSTDIRLLDCTAHDVSGGDGFYVGESSAATECQRVWLTRCRTYDNGRQGLSVVSGINVWLNECVSSGNTNGGIDIEPGAGETVANVSLESCRSYSNGDDGIVVANAAIDGARLHSCVAYSNGNKGFNTSLVNNLTLTSCTAYSNTDEGFFFSSVVIFTATGCRAEGNNYGFRMSNSCVDGQIIGGVAEGNTVDGLLIQSGTTHCGATGHFTAKNNTQSGINLAGTENAIDGCISHGNGRYGIDAASLTRGSIRNNSIYGNSQTTHNTYSGIRLTSTSADCQVAGNKVYRGGGANKQKWGISIEGGANTTATLVVNNDLTNGGATAAYNDVGTGTITNLDGSANNWNRLL